MKIEVSANTLRKFYDWNQQIKFKEVIAIQNDNRFLVHPIILEARLNIIHLYESCCLAKKSRSTQIKS
jgi:hypothetical protein